MGGGTGVGVDERPNLENVVSLSIIPDGWRGPDYLGLRYHCGD